MKRCICGVIISFSVLFTIGILNILLKCIDFYAQKTVEQHFYRAALNADAVLR